MALFDPALLEYVAEQREFNANVMEATKALASIDTATPEGLAWIRDAMKPGGLFGFQTYDFPVVREIPGPAGTIPIRVMTPEVVNGVYLHYHGGGMTMGSALSMDARNWQIAEACNVAVVSVDYRLAPEHPFPAGPDDAEAAALWLVDNAQAEFGTDRLLVGGESAGAYLALLTMVRLRDRLGRTPPFAGVDLCYGVYDWGGTPSSKQMIGKVPYATGDATNRKHYLPGRSIEEARDPAVSPLWRPLHDLPPALLTVGNGGLAAGRFHVPRGAAASRGLAGRASGLSAGAARHRGVGHGAREGGPRAAARLPARVHHELAEGIRITVR